jgi:hypothetical protein
MLSAFEQAPADGAMPASGDPASPTTPRALLEALLQRAAAPAPDPQRAGWRQRLRAHGRQRRVLEDAVPTGWPVIEHAAAQAEGACFAALVEPPGKPVAGVVVMTDARATKSRSAIVAAAARQSFRMLGLA